MESFETPWGEQEKRRQLVNQHGENSPRQAMAFATFKTTGWGETEFPDCYEFDLTFAERPFVSYGYSVIRNTEVDEDEILISTRFPRSWGGVYGWKQNKHDFYTGAWCFVVVESQSPYIITTEVEPFYTIQHHFVFTAMGIKDIPDWQVDSQT